MGELQQKLFPVPVNFACGLEGSPAPDNDAVKHSSVTALNCSNLSAKCTLGTAQDPELAHTEGVTTRPGSSACCAHLVPFGAVPLEQEPSPLLHSAYRDGHEALLHQE